MYACAELFCVLTNVSNKFVFGRFPLRGGSSPLSPPCVRPGPHPNQIIVCFFLIETRLCRICRRLAESVDGSNSSLAIEASELLSKMCRPICRPARSSKGYCVTITWQQICKGSRYITVAGVLLHETVERRRLGR